jgi:hypothetical protein
MFSNTRVYGFEESITASGYPKAVDVSKTTFSLDRAKKLAACKSGTGHDCFLKGIVVQTNITAPSYWWPQFQRYHFADIISSQSKMHCINSFDIENSCNKYVDPEIKKILSKYVQEYNNEKTTDNFLKVLSNTPMGFNLTARIVTNYLQLKTIYIQRRNHKLPEWKEFCKWISSLPNALDLICI